MAASMAAPALPAPRRPARLLAAAVAVLLLPMAGCLAPPGPLLDGGPCPAPLELPDRLPDVETRTVAGGNEVRDATGTWTRVDNLTRLVPTSHDLVELLFLMGHGERVVAVPNWIDHPPGPHPEGIDGLKRLGRPHNIPAEDVADAAPTLVLDKPHPLQGAPIAPPLRSAGIGVVVFDGTEDLATLARTYAKLAAVLTGVDPDAPAKAQALWDGLAAELALIHDRIERHTSETGAHCPRTMYMFPANLAAGDGTAASLLLELAGASSLAKQAGLQGYRTMSRETLLAGDPERVVGTTTGGLPSPQSPRWSPTLAAHLGPQTFIAVDPAITGLTGPRFAEGVALVAEWLHPAAFGLIDPHVVTEKQVDQDGGLTLTVDATQSRAATGELRFRFLPATAGSSEEDPEGRFTHTYPQGTRTHAYLLLVDEQERIHTTRIPIEA